MTFKLTLLCSFVLLARPQDVLTFLQPVRPALVLTVLAMAALFFGGHRRELAAALSTREAKRYLLFFALMILGIPFAYHKGLAFDSVLLGYTGNVFFFVLLVSQVTSLQRLKSLLWVICLSTMAYSVFGGLLQAGNSDAGRFEVMGGAFDPNDTAYVLLALFPLCLYFVQFNAGLVKRLVAIAAICGAVATILLTGSRGGIIAFGAVLLVLLLTRTAGVGIGRKMLLVLLLAASGFLIRDKINVERYLTLSDLSSDYNLTSQGGRIELWKEALDLSLAHPFTGVGVDNFAFANDHARRLAGESHLRWEAVHNSYLQVAAEVGLIGFTVYVLIYLRSLRTFVRLGRSRPQSAEALEIAALSGSMLLGFTGLMISGFFLSQGYSIFSTLYFALAASLARLQSQPSAAAEAPRPALDDPEEYQGDRMRAG